MSVHNSYVNIDLDAIAHNFAAVQNRAGVPVMAVVKADAYGHGAVPIASLLEPQCAMFGVSSIQEALELRRAGIGKPILILGHTPVDAYEDAIRQGIRPAIFRPEDGLALSEVAQRLGLPAPFHFAVDTGMSRIGFQVCQQDADICAKIAALPGLVPEGLFSHFATADSSDLTKTQAQAARFAAFDEMLKARGVIIPIRHLNNSAGIIQFGGRYEMVRSGIVTYGLYPSPEVPRDPLPLIPALSWLSHVTHVKTLPAGREISYGGTFVTEKDTVVATIPVGYADGYRRQLSGRFYVLINGKKAPILGRICMDQLMVDVTDIPGAAVGSKVTLIGTDGDETISMEAIASQAGSFPYEFACGISRRVLRNYISGGKILRCVDYLLDP